ncbi:MAG: stage II sporulation protein R [Halanaerobiaceae bacterium]|nr:stage II sporulation protein R [Halanaerobiaceae bacterium]
MVFKRLRIILFLIFLCIILMSINVNSAFQSGDNEGLINAFAEDNLLRLHVIANTNSPRDQYIKRLVRDRITEYIASLAASGKLEIDNLILEEYLGMILKEEGVKYKARVELGEYYFPTRTYDELRLEAGNYKALKVILGKGEGSNWWCVLLPPLCIEEAENIDSDKKLEFRLKIVEWLQGKDKEEKMNYAENKELVKLVDTFSKMELKPLFEVEPFYEEFKLIDIELLKPLT